jgi:tRNA A37 threonylcarbamoyladenosine biosynthesis protein TsaE
MPRPDGKSAPTNTHCSLQNQFEYDLMHFDFYKETTKEQVQQLDLVTKIKIENP